MVALRVELRDGVIKVHAPSPRSFIFLQKKSSRLPVPWPLLLPRPPCPHWTQSRRPSCCAPGQVGREGAPHAGQPAGSGRIHKAACVLRPPSGKGKVQGCTPCLPASGAKLQRVNSQGWHLEVPSQPRQWKRLHGAHHKGRGPAAEETGTPAKRQHEAHGRQLHARPRPELRRTLPTSHATPPPPPRPTAPCTRTTHRGLSLWRMSGQ